MRHRTHRVDGDAAGSGRVGLVPRAPRQPVLGRGPRRAMTRSRACRAHEVVARRGRAVSGSQPRVPTRGLIRLARHGGVGPAAYGEGISPALSPSQAADFKQCPLLYRFRTVDKLEGSAPPRSSIAERSCTRCSSSVFRVPRQAHGRRRRAAGAVVGARRGASGWSGVIEASGRPRRRQPGSGRR